MICDQGHLIGPEEYRNADIEASGIPISGETTLARMRDHPVLTYSQRLVAAREHAGLTQKQLAAEVQVPLSTLAEAETKGKRASSYTPKVAQICRVNPLWLATGEGEMLPTQSAQGLSSASGAVELDEELATAEHELEEALTKLADAFRRADELTTVQVTPLFSMLFNPSNKGNLEAGTIARRIAELLSPVTVPSADTVLSKSKTNKPAVRTVTLPGRKGQSHGTSNKPQGEDGGKPSSHRSTRRNAR
jgi:transcriptional regulator with XRE-family HTH domain